MVRIVCISDTHCRHRELKIPDGDILIHAGDITNRGELETLEDFNDWLGTLPHKQKIVIPGNHDFCFQERPELCRYMLTHCILLIHESTEAQGLQIFGSPWTPWFHDWAFNIPRNDGEQAELLWSEIPDDTDILVTHGPPYNILDKTIRGDRTGCPHLLDKILSMQHTIHIFGHIHEAYGYRIFRSNAYINASSLNEFYKPTNDAKIVDI